MPVVTAKRIFFWIRSQTKTKSLNFSTHFRLMDFIKLILWNSPNFHSCCIFQEIKFSSYELQFLHTAYLYPISSLKSYIPSHILSTYQKFSSYLVSFQKIYLCFFSSSFRSDTNWHPSFGNGYTRTVPGSRVVPTL